ncbi:NAD(P)-dependent oxidoreductase [Paenibacillus nasutitermitis]|uniref:D-isomer specific 2-hydroxyacid dehydrogenase NAD-binding domain-containing protein n=1 Tax=Paenibacillus nasutitermitis TaxID=1652958 RepID=A0A917DYY5_9BACL|nr:NAD(P)-dependent oxidoreductase [Paenibacillus nasutitermitis]GGD83372.1 hypothetical protein GCM10010911_46920 [Paenibacillus nasutitermitis]
MSSIIVVHPDFDRIWPYSADHLLQLWQEQGEAELIRVSPDFQGGLDEVVNRPGEVTRLVALGLPVTKESVEPFAALKEAVIIVLGHGGRAAQEVEDSLKERGVKLYVQPSEGFWGQSVSEFALALTLCGLRRIPQLHHEILTSIGPWDYPLEQFGDDPNFTNGTVAGKRVRIVGAGNIASRYASFVHMLGADVAAWDPYAPEPSFHRAGSRREWHLDRLVRDAEIFVPMVPLTDSTEGLVTAQHIRALPKGTLVVLATRAGIVDMEELRRRVLADELSLAADVFDIEPLPLDDPLLGRHNVVHTPHNAGRTLQANQLWAKMLVDQFL